MSRGRCSNSITTDELSIIVNKNVLTVPTISKNVDGYVAKILKSLDELGTKPRLFGFCHILP